jgi:hypothetical protein
MADSSETKSLPEVYNINGVKIRVFDDKSLIPLANIENASMIKKSVDYFETLEASFGSSESVLSNFRVKSEPINMRDLSDEIQDILETGYDDTYVRNRIGIIEKALEDTVNKCDLTIYRKRSVPITRYDLSDDLINYIRNGGKDTNEFDALIGGALDKKTDKTESGLIKDLDPLLASFIDTGDEVNPANMIDAINFLFKFVNVYTTDDRGYVTQNVGYTEDYGEITGSVSEVIDFGSITAHNDIQI